MKTKTLSDTQKKKMAEGRRQTRIVESYLRQLEERSTRKKQVSPKDIQGQIQHVEKLLESAVGVERLSLLQQREDLQRLALEAKPDDDGQLEEQFVAVAGAYARRKGISYSTWREFGVSKDVLAAAGIARTRRPNQVKI